MAIIWISADIDHFHHCRKFFLTGMGWNIIFFFILIIIYCISLTLVTIIGGIFYHLLYSLFFALFLSVLLLNINPHENIPNTVDSQFLDVLCFLCPSPLGHSLNNSELLHFRYLKLHCKILRPHVPIL